MLSQDICGWAARCCFVFDLVANLFVPVHLRFPGHSQRNAWGCWHSSREPVNYTLPGSPFLLSDDTFTSADRVWKRRWKRQVEESQSPPKILPDLPSLRRFFDRTGLHVRCRATGNPPPKISWFTFRPQRRSTQAVSSSLSSDDNDDHEITRHPSSTSIPTERCGVVG